MGTTNNTKFGYVAASDGYNERARVPACESPVAYFTSKCGWVAQMRSSSAPVNPDAPIMPTDIIA